jgi:hypothetical protein
MGSHQGYHVKTGTEKVTSMPLMFQKIRVLTSASTTGTTTTREEEVKTREKKRIAKSARNAKKIRPATTIYFLHSS